jgi:hypothetical protein
MSATHCESAVNDWVPAVERRRALALDWRKFVAENSNHDDRLFNQREMPTPTLTGNQRYFW